MNPPYIPATALGGSLLAPYLPVTMEWHADDDPSRWVSGVIITIEEARDGTRVIWYSIDLYVGFDNRSPVFLRLDSRREEVATRIATVLRARGHEVSHLLPVALGGRQGDVTAEVPCEICGGDGYHKGPRLGDEPCPDCGGSGTIRRTIPAADVSALTLAASVAGVEAGAGVVRGLLGEWHQHGNTWVRTTYAGTLTWPSCNAGGWGVADYTPGGHRLPSLASGPETGPEGRAAADAALLRLGYAYLSPAAPFGVVVPFNLENER